MSPSTVAAVRWSFTRPPIDTSEFVVGRVLKELRKARRLRTSEMMLSVPEEVGHVRLMPVNVLVTQRRSGVPATSPG